MVKQAELDVHKKSNKACQIKSRAKFPILLRGEERKLVVVDIVDDVAFIVDIVVYIPRKRENPWCC